MIPTNEKIRVVSSDGVDDWGRPIDPVTTEYKCRIDYQNDVVKSDSGEDVVSKATILIKGVALVTTADTIEWTDAYGEHSAQPVTVNPIKDLSHKVIFTKVVI